jgi:hypothetical protein
VISEIHTGCGCVEANLPQNRINSEASGELRVTMEVDGYGQTTPIYVFSNDPQNPIMQLSVRAEPAMELMVEPSVVDFGQVESVDALPTKKSIKLFLNTDVFSKQGLNNLSFMTSEPYLHIDRFTRIRW